MKLGERIKEQRIKKGFSQEKIAELVGTSRQAVTKWETGQSIPCMENLMTLAEIFDISLDELSSGISYNASGTDSPAQNNQKKSFLFADIIFIIIALFAVMNILRIPAHFGLSVVGFFQIIIQAAAVLFVPLYLFWLRPRWLKRKAKNNETKDEAGVTIKVKFLTGISAGGFLFLGYLLCGHVFLFLHGMRQWPIFLLIMGLFFITISAVSYYRKVMISTVVGYVVGFACGMLFNSDIYQPDPGIYSNNNWQIWTFVFWGFVAAGIVWQHVDKRIKNTRKC